LSPAHTRRIQQVRRRWWVVLVVAVLVMLAAALPSLKAHPMYVGKTALMLASPGRSPDQDAMMAVGYSIMFNEPATIRRLRATTYVPEDATFEARTVAASPILIIEATADNPEAAQEAATNMAGAFRDDINSVRQKGADDAIAELERQFNEMLQQAPAAPDGSPNPMLAPLRERIDVMRFDTTNQLMDLQPRAGVTTIAPDPVFNVGVGAVGGLLLGILAALGMAALSTRLRNSADLLDKTGIEPLVEVPSTGSTRQNRLREDRLRALANIVSLQDFPKSTVLALTDSRGARGARELAESLARLSAQQGYRTVLVYADNHASQPIGDAGFNEALVDSSLVHSALIDGEVESLKIVPSGSVVVDRYSRVTREKIVAVLDELRTCADTIVVAAPSIADTTETQTVCAAADLTILVVAKGSSRAGDVTSAVEALANAHAVLLGAVLIDATNGR
jgi:succinoglycan biosynthesis transport protein ExoP